MNKLEQDCEHRHVESRHFESLASQTHLPTILGRFRRINNHWAPDGLCWGGHICRPFGIPAKMLKPESNPQEMSKRIQDEGRSVDYLVHTLQMHPRRENRKQSFHDVYQIIMMYTLDILQFYLSVIP